MGRRLKCLLYICVIYLVYPKEEKQKKLTIFKKTFDSSFIHCSINKIKTFQSVGKIVPFDVNIFRFIHNVCGLKLSYHTNLLSYCHLFNFELRKNLSFNKMLLLFTFVIFKYFFRITKRVGTWIYGT